MHFSNPGFLWALSLLIIPIIIHLFKFRRYKQVQFPNVRFLKRIDEEQKAKRRLKDILILLARLLALASLVLAFSIPYLGSGTRSSKGNVVSIYIDNSFSMENESEQGKLLDIAKKKAEELVMTFQPSDQFQIITNDLESRHQRIVNRQGFLQFLYEIDLSASTVSLSDIYRRQLTLLENEVDYNRWIAFISDFQRSSANIDQIDVDEDYKLLVFAIEPDNYTNLYIDSIWFDSPLRQIGKSETLHFSVQNKSNENLDEVAITLNLNGQMKSMATISLAAQSKKDTLLHYSNETKAGIQNAILSIDDKPIVFDNEYFFSYTLKEKINVCELRGKEASNYYNLIFSDSLFEFTSYSVDQIDFERIGKADFIVFNELSSIPSGLSSFIEKWIEDGGHLLLSPSMDFDQDDYNAFLRNYRVSISAKADTNDRRVSYVELKNELYLNVFKKAPQGRTLPNTYSHYPIKYGDLEWKTLFELQGADVFLGLREVGDGRIYIQAIPGNSEWSNWSRPALFVTTLYRMAEQSQRSEIMDHRIGDWSVVEVKTDVQESSRPFELKAQDGSAAFIPTQQWIKGRLSLGVKDEVKQSGFYDLMNADLLLNTLAFNYSRLESDLSFYTSDDLNKWVDNNDNIKMVDVSSRPIKKSNIRDERPLWKSFLLLGLVFLLIEILIIKFMKRK